MVGNLSVSNVSANNGVSGKVEFSQQAGKKATVMYHFKLIDGSGELQFISGAADIETTSNVTNLRFKFGTGNVASGRILPMTLDLA